MVEKLPVVVVGAGPVGLAAAAHLVERGLEPVVLEAGVRAGTAVREWGHVRLFSPWAGLIDPAARRLLEQAGWQEPDRSVFPTGAEWAAGYLDPLAAALGGRVRWGTRVVGVARRGRDRVVDAGRDTEPLTVHAVGPHGAARRQTADRVTARAVIDASGTWANPNPLGGDGLPAVGEHAVAPRITYRVPDLARPEVRSRYAGRHVAVAGSGHSALTALVAFARLAEERPGTRVTWVLRRDRPGDAFGRGTADQLARRGALGERARAAVDAGAVWVVTGFRTMAVDRAAGRLVLVAGDGRRLGGIDEVVALTGFRPDLSWLSEVRLGLDATLQAPLALAPLIDPNVHTCGTVPPHGARELTQPEPGVFVVGMKSYGRAPTFLTVTGYEQVRSVAALLAGDREGALRTELTMPSAGGDGGTGLPDEAAAGPADQVSGNEADHEVPSSPGRAGAGGCALPTAAEGGAARPAPAAVAG